MGTLISVPYKGKQEAIWTVCRVIEHKQSQPENKAKSGLNLESSDSEQSEELFEDDSSYQSEDGELFERFYKKRQDDFDKTEKEYKKEGKNEPRKSKS